MDFSQSFLLNLNGCILLFSCTENTFTPGILGFCFSKFIISFSLIGKSICLKLSSSSYIFFKVVYSCSVFLKWMKIS